jgi:hypothetical protein
MLRVLLDENNDIPPGGPRLVDGEQSAAVALQAVYSTQAGEWPYDLRFGTLWRQEVFGKFFNAATTSQVIADAGNSWVPDIVPMTDAQITIDTTTQAEFRQADITVDDLALRSSTPVAGLFTFTISTNF